MLVYSDNIALGDKIPKAISAMSVMLDVGSCAYN